MTGTRLPRVLLLEDDAGVRRFVQLALAAWPLELVACARLDEALQELASASVQLVLTDLVLPDGSGLDLLQWLHDQDAGEACRSVVLSGGVTESLRQQLQARGVWRVLSKPVAVGCLQACVRQALGLPDRAALGQEPSPPDSGVDPVTEFFGGNLSLFEAYRHTCLAQFAKDLKEGDLAMRAGDIQTLRRVAHNLKSALTLVGWPHAAQLARSTEEDAAQAALESARAGWQRLRQQVHAGLAQHRGPESLN